MRIFVLAVAAIVAASPALAQKINTLSVVSPSASDVAVISHGYSGNGTGASANATLSSILNLPGSTQYVPFSGGTLTGGLTVPALTSTGNISGAVLPTGATTALDLSHLFAYSPNVMAFGAKLDGTTNDTAAFNAARGAVGTNGTVFVPPGGWDVLAAPTAGPSTPVLWHLSGNGFGAAGTPPVVGIGTDVVETVLDGGRFLTRTHTVDNPAPVLRVDSHDDNSGGTRGVSATLQVNTTIPAAGNGNNLAWGLVSVINSSATVNSGNNSMVAVNGTTNRLSGAVGGPELFGGNLVASDQTGQASSVSGAAVAFEGDVQANAPDDGGSATTLPDGVTLPSGQGIRVLGDFVAQTYGAGSDPEVGWGVRVGGEGTIDRAFSANAAIGRAAFTTEYAVLAAGADAYRMVADQPIDFTADGNHLLSYSSADGALNYSVDGAKLLSVADPATAPASYFSLSLNQGTNTLLIKPGGAAANLQLSGSGIGAQTIGSSTSGLTVLAVGHLRPNGTAPTVSACGTSPSISATASDVRGTITEGTSATGCTINFDSAYSPAPDCVVSSPTGTTATGYTVSTTALTISNASGSSAKFTYMCMQ